MTDHVLVTYGSWAGSAEEVAEEIARTMSDADCEVDVIPADRVVDIEAYDAVVIGSAIHASQMHPSVLAFLDKYRDTLVNKRVAYFLVCLTMKDDTDENRCKVASYLEAADEIAPDIEPVATGLFAGAMIYKKLPLGLRLIIKAMKAEEGDYRDWDTIRRWAGEIKGLLLHEYSLDK